MITWRHMRKRCLDGRRAWLGSSLAWDSRSDAKSCNAQLATQNILEPPGQCSVQRNTIWSTSLHSLSCLINACYGRVGSPWLPSADKVMLDQHLCIHKIMRQLGRISLHQACQTPPS